MEWEGVQIKPRPYNLGRGMAIFRDNSFNIFCDIQVYTVHVLD